MKVYTSYFYQIRFFKPNMIPISTARFDPSWYHENKSPEHWFIDRNGVINGLRAPVFAPGQHLSGLCAGACNPKSPDECLFLKGYQNQLNNLDFENTMKRLEVLCFKVSEYLGLEEEPIAILIVHEAPDNPCSERTAIQNFFRNNGIKCEEWKRG